MSVKVRKFGKKHGLDIHHKGKRVKRVVGTKAAAERAKIEVEKQIAIGQLGMLDKPACPTFRYYSRTYLAFIQSHRAPSTYTRFRGLTETLNKDLGNKPIDEITRGDVKRVLLQHAKRYAPATINLMHTVASGIFQEALEDEKIHHKPTRDMIRRLGLDRQQEEIKPLEADEMERALELLPRDLYPLFLFLYLTGARIGEALALDWDSVNLVVGKATIGKTAKDQLIREVTKTYIKREVELAHELVEVLLDLRRMDKKHCIAHGRRQHLVFHRHSRLLSDNTVRRNWSRACKQTLGEHRRLHDIRHTYASLMLNRGVPVTYVSKQLGHSSSSITLNKYSHYMPTENKGYAEVLGVKGNLGPYRGRFAP